MAINKVMLTGNLTCEPELGQTTGGTAVLSFGIAVNERIYNKSKETWEDYPNFFDCKMFGKRAEGVSKYLSKGMKVAIEGKLHYGSWYSEGGSKRSKVGVTVDEIDFTFARNSAQNHAESGYASEDVPF